MNCSKWGQIIRERDKTCQVKIAAFKYNLYDDKYICKGQLEADHLVERSKVHKKHYTNAENGLLLCAWHHRLSPELSHHGNKRAFRRFIADYMPEVQERIERILSDNSKWSMFE